MTSAGTSRRYARTGAGGITADEIAHMFVALLCRPLLTPHADPELHRQITRNIRDVEEHGRRLGYRITVIGRVIRLIRTPIAGQVCLPPAPVDPPTRHVLALTCVLAAACEETSGNTTIARLSELVTNITSTPDVAVGAYDQARQANRRALLAAARLLEYWGVLVRRLSDERLLGAWTDGGNGIGTIYLVNREALLLLANPDTLAVILEHAHALTEQPSPAGSADGIEVDQWAATRSMRLLRALVETPAVTYSELEEGDADTLRTMRGLRSADAAAITGGHIEARAEGLLLVLPDQHPPGATIDWPRAESRSWAALEALDHILTSGTRQPDGTVTCTESQAHTITDAIATGPRAKYLAAALRDLDALHAAIEAQLTALGLLRVTPDRSWALSPAAARYRNATFSDADTAPDDTPSADDLHTVATGAPA